MAKNKESTELAREKRLARKERKKQLKEMFSLRHYLVLMWACSMIRLYVSAKTKMSQAFRKQKKSGAMLIVSNHVSALDFAYFTTPFWGKRVSFVVAENMMYSTPFLATVIQGYHTITKKQFFADYTCVKNIKRYLDAGISVIICPEGKVSADGKTGPIASSIAKLVKWLGYPVASCVICGGGITRPKWASNMRHARVECNMDMLFSAEDTKALTQQQIAQQINEALSHNEHLWQIKNGVKCRGRRLAEGLEKLLYKCPSCGEEFVIATKGSKISCGKCGFEAEYTNRGLIVPKEPVGEHATRIDLWYDWEKEAVQSETRDSDFTLEKPVYLFIENEKRNGYRFITAGQLKLTRDVLSFQSSLTRRSTKADSTYHIGAMDFAVENDSTNTEPVEAEFMELSFPIKNFITIANIPGDSLDLYDQNHTYRMMFSEEKASTKFVLAIEEINNSH